MSGEEVNWGHYADAYKAIRNTVASADSKLTDIKTSEESMDIKLGAIKDSEASIDTKLTDIKSSDTSIDTKLTTTNDKLTSVDTKLTDIKNSDASIDTKLTDIKNSDASIDSKLTDIKNSDASIDSKLSTANDKLTSIDNKLPILGTSNQYSGTYSPSGSGSTTLISGASGKTIKVYDFYLWNSGTADVGVRLYFETSDGNLFKGKLAPKTGVIKTFVRPWESDAGKGVILYLDAAGTCDYGVGAIQA